MAVPPTPNSRRALLKHQPSNCTANLIWGPPLPPELAALAPGACEKLHATGYFASPFPEGDGVTLHHPDYSPSKALAHIREAFPWLTIQDHGVTEADLYHGTSTPCTILIPVEKLRLTRTIQAEPYRFIPALGDDEGADSHPWHEYLSCADQETLYAVWEEEKKRGTRGLRRDDYLLTFPLIEAPLTIPYAELYDASEGGDGMIPLLLRCVECADRGLDIIRGRFCNHKFQMQVPGLAGQLLDGFHAAYVIPASGPFKDKLYCHPATPFHVTSNWLGLEVDHGLNQEDVALAPIVHGGPATEMFMRLRAAVRALGQAFYILTPESRFLSLVFAIDGLCAPNEKWKGLPHRTYIAAVAADGERKLFATLLKDFDTAYTEVRNSIVHQGKSFVELGIDPIHSLKHLDRILGLCIETVMRHSFNTSAQLHKHALTTLGQADFQSEIMNYAAHVAALSGKHHKVTLPKW